MRSRWQLILGIAVSAIFVSMALKGLDVASVGKLIREANYLWILPGISVYFLGVWARTWRWHYMLRHLQDIPMYPAFPHRLHRLYGQ